MRIVLTADTHVPKRARNLPASLWRAIEDADVVVHAGDWVDVALLDEFEARAARVVGVYGNNDGPPLRARLPEVARVELAGVRLAVVHETGPAAGRERRCAQRFPDVDVLVFGHSHIPWDSTGPLQAPGPSVGAPQERRGGLRLLNPGSPTDRRRQPVATYMTAEIDDEQLIEVRLHSVTHPF
jgi:putative phosphoesterase